MAAVQKVATSGESTGVVEFVFRGDTLDVVKASDGRVFVSIRRVCDGLGVDFATQGAKVRSDPATTVGLIPTVGADGKRRDMLGIEVRSLPLWVATIHPSKVKPAVREKLIAYKREAAEALADFFIGKRGSYSVELDRLNSLIRDTMDARAALRLKEQAFYKKQQRLLDGQRSTVCDAELADIRGLLVEVVDLWLALGRADTKRAALQFVKHRAIPGAFSKGFRLRYLPKDQVPGILRALEVLRSDAHAEAVRRGLVPAPTRRRHPVLNLRK